VRRTIAGIVAVGALVLVWRFVSLPECGEDTPEEQTERLDAVSIGDEAPVRFDARPRIDADPVAPAPAVGDALVHVMYPDDVVCFVRELLGSEGPPFIDPRIERIASKLDKAPFDGLTNWQYRAMTRFEGTADRAELISNDSLAIYVEGLDDREGRSRVVIVREDGTTRSDTRMTVRLSRPVFVAYTHEPAGVTVVLWYECAMR
jgi:hypothetical protein